MQYYQRFPVCCNSITTHIRRLGAVVYYFMKAKNFLKGMLAHHMMRHRQHRRFMHNVGAQLRHFGPTRGLLVLGALAMAGRFLQKKRAARSEQLPQVEAEY